MNVQVLEHVREWSSTVTERSWVLAKRNQLAIASGAAVSSAVILFLFTFWQISNGLIWQNLLLLDGLTFSYVYTRTKARVYTTIGIGLGSFAVLAIVIVPFGFVLDLVGPRLALVSLYVTNAGGFRSAVVLSASMVLSGLVAAGLARPMAAVPEISGRLRVLVKRQPTVQLLQLGPPEQFYDKIQKLTEDAKTPELRQKKWELWALAPDPHQQYYAVRLSLEKRITYGNALKLAADLKAQGQNKVGRS